MLSRNSQKGFTQSLTLPLRSFAYGAQQYFTAYTGKVCEKPIVRTRLRTTAKFSAGFTFIEVLVLVAIIVVIMILITSSFSFVYKGQRFAFEQADATRSARLGIEKTVRDIREASFADDGAYSIVSMATSSVTFFSDYDNDGKIERVRYFLDGTDFKKGTIESSGDPPTYATSSEVVSIVSDNVRNTAVGIPLFTFYDRAGILMADLSEVDELAFVLARLVVNLHPERAPEDFELRSSAALRNTQ